MSARFPSTQVLRAVGREGGGDDPLGALVQLGVDRDGLQSDPLSAGRALGALVGELEAAGPVLLVLDDLQWMDPESLDAVAALLERMAGDRVLVAACHRPVGPRHAQWALRLERLPSVERVVLDGLDEESTIRLTEELAPSATLKLIRSLRAHTGGNPLFLRSLLHEYSVDELTALAANNDLPATEAVARTMEARLSGLDPDATAVLYALAILGDDGGRLSIIEGVSGVADATPALELLRGYGLIQFGRTAGDPSARIFHGVVRAEVYRSLPGAERQRLHRIAAACVLSPSERLQHRAAGAAGAGRRPRRRSRRIRRPAPRAQPIP